MDNLTKEKLKSKFEEKNKSFIDFIHVKLISLFLSSLNSYSHIARTLQLSHKRTKLVLIHQAGNHQRAKISILKAIACSFCDKINKQRSTTINSFTNFGLNPSS